MKTRKCDATVDGPADAELEQQLGRSRLLWDRLVASVERAHPPVEREWRWAETAGVWYLRLTREGRTIFYLLPRDQSFLTAFILGDKAVQVVRARRFSPTIRTALDEANPCGAGCGIRLATRNRREVETMLRLAAIKLAN